MRKFTTFILLAFFGLFLLNQNVSASTVDKMTGRLVQKMSSVKGDDFIKINISLKEQLDSQQLIKTTSSMKITERRAYVISVLKEFSQLSQSGVLAELTQMQRNATVKNVTTLWINNIISCYATPDAIEELAGRDDVLKVDYDQYHIVIDPAVRKNAFPEQGYSGNREITWNVLKINAQEVWALGYDGEGVVVAVIDTGVNYNHVDLENNLWEHPDFPYHGYNFVSNSNNPMDDHGHGTHCAGTVAGDGTAGSQTGVAPGASIMCLKVLDGGGGGEESSVWEAVQFSVENGAHVMSLSLGWSHSWNPDRAAFRQAFDNALAAGLIASVAAGNEGSGNEPSNVRTPGDCPPPWLHPEQNPEGEVSGVVCVGATNSSDGVAGFSSRGPVTWQNITPYNDFPYQPEMGLLRPDIAAPGDGIKSLAHYNNTGYESGWSGTSMATPAVAGVMALMLQKNNLLEPFEMNQILEETPVVLEPGKNNNSGSGRVDALAAIEEVSAVARPTDLVGSVTFETGEVELSWEFEPEPGFEFFRIYRDEIEIATTTDLFFSETLPGYGIYDYKVTAQHELGESSAAKLTLQWGDAHVAVDPTEIIENIEAQSTSTRYITVENTGQLDLIYEVSSSTEPIDGIDDYCIPSANCSFGDGITGFAMGDINNMSNGCSSNGYGDFTDMSTEIQIGNSYEITLETGYSSQFVSIWIDADKNEVFDSNEMILEGFELANSNQIYTATVTIPDNMQSGETRMRVKAEWLDVPTDPCENVSYGETEDYTVNISGWMYVDRFVDTINPGNTNTFEVLFDSEDLTEGTYYGNIKIESNDPDAPEVNVPVTLNVGSGFPLALNVLAEPSTVCQGESSFLEAIPTGGTGDYTYAWTSDPEGFTSTDPNPVVTPDETTIFFVEVSDDENSIEGEVVVTVEHTPDQAAQPEGETDMCWGVYQTVYQSQGAEGALDYNWVIDPATAGTIEANGLTATISWDEEFTGMATIMVEGINLCGTGEMSEELEVMMHELPEVDLGADMTVCANEIIILDAGNPGATYLWSTGETTQTIEVDTTGVGIGMVEISVEVTDLNTCSSGDVITIQFDDCTGISGISENRTVKVFPNPSDGVFSIQLTSHSDDPVNLMVVDAFGKEIYTRKNVFIQNSGRISLDLKNIPDGIYMLNIYSEGVNMMHKIVIQK
jgi:subtilisin family serine protease